MNKEKKQQTKVARPVPPHPASSRQDKNRGRWLAGVKTVRRSDNDEENASFVRGYN